MTVLRPLQERALEQLRVELRRGHRRVMLMAPTGFGKTVVATAMMRNAHERGIGSMFVVDRLPLVDQVSERLEAEGLRHGVIQGQHWRHDPRALIQVASIQTLARRRWPDHIGLVIHDEAHVLHQAHIDLMERWSNVPYIGLSATPFRKGLGKHFQALCVPTSTQELIDQGWLVDFRAFAPSAPDLAGVRTVRGDYDETQLSERTNKPTLVADIIDTWKKRAEGRQTICFAVDIAHSRNLAGRFQAEGIKAVHLDTYDKADERRETIEAFKRGEIDILCNVGLLDKGFDHPACSCVIQARPTKSLIIHVQQIGRALRTAPGKEDALILDHAGNHQRLGFVTDALPTALDDGNNNRAEYKREEPLPKLCPICKSVRKAGEPCAACGWTPKERERAIEMQEGELTELKKKREPTMEEKASFYAQLKALGFRYGRNPGWADHTYRAKFGVWPNKMKNLDSEEPTPEVIAFARSRDIRNAKGRKDAWSNGYASRWGHRYDDSN